MSAGHFLLNLNCIEEKGEQIFNKYSTEVNLMMKKLFFLSFILWFVGCSSSQKQVDKTEFSKDNPVIKMEKTNCYGRCPVYSLEIRGNGKVLLEGKENLSKIGKYILRIDEDEIARVIKAIDESGFWGMNDEYDGRVTDLPSTYISVEYNGKSKSIKSRFKAPKELDDLEDLLSEYLQRFGWEKIVQ